MPHTHSAPTAGRIAVTALFFALAVVAGEITFGNRAFPINVWYFTRIPAWHWSLPVHAAGLVWLLVFNRLFLNRSALVPILLSTLFFTAGETLNRFFWGFFAYAGATPAARILSFWLVIAMYLGLCTATVLLLRVPGRKDRSDNAD